ncbi:MAG: RT0821/Lpp0805 family surface protein [Alphaproteobacteria bacterium]
MKVKVIIPALVAAFALTACTGDAGQKQTIGALGGAIAGGVIGSQFGGGSGQLIMTGIGTLLGAWAGSEIGASLDRADQAYAAQAAQTSFENSPTGQATTWRNPDSGHYGTITPTNTVQRGGSVCREFTQSIYVDGRSETAVGTACRNPDGTWSIVQS